MELERRAGKVGLIVLGFSLTDGVALTGVSTEELWWRYVAIGGHAAPALLGREISGETVLDRDEHDLIAQALNECFLDAGVRSFPVAYAEPFPGGRRGQS